MFTTGSKVLLSATTVTAGLAVAYGVLDGGALGTFGLIFAALGLLLLSAFYIAVRDADVSPMDHDAFPSSAAAQATSRPSLWPLLTAAGVLVVAYGLVSNLAFVLVGIVLTLAGGVEWLVQNWSEHISSDRRYNSKARESLIDPVEIPVGGALFAGVVAFGFSRVMLGLPSKTATVIAFVVLAAVVLALGAWVSSKRSLSRPGMLGIVAVGVALVGVVGLIFGINGPREVEAHETTVDLAAENKCGTEETHADENATQGVIVKSGMAAVIVYDGSELSGRMPGVDDKVQLNLLRNTALDIRFRNESNEDARLVFELPSADANTADGEGEGEAESATSEDAVEEDHGPAERVCTTLVEPGGEQILTMVVHEPSFAVEQASGEGYAFTIAGSDAQLEVNVP